MSDTPAGPPEEAPSPDRRPLPASKRTPGSPDDPRPRAPGDAGRQPVPAVPVRFAEQKQEPATPPEPGPERAPKRHRPRLRRLRYRTPARGYLGEVRGCLLPLVGIGTVVAALVALALFLPPFSLWEEIDQALNNGDDATPSAALIDVGPVDLAVSVPRLAADGLLIEVPSEALTGSFSVRVVALAAADYLAGHMPEAGWHCAAVLPARHALAGPVYSLTQSGTPPERLTLQLSTLNGEGGPLELQGWNADTGAWEFIPAQPGDDPGALVADLTYLPRCVALFREAESLRRVGVTLGVGDTFDPAALAQAGGEAVVARLYPGRLRPSPDGTLQVVLAPGFETGRGYDVLPLLRNFDNPAVIDTATVRRILENPALREEHARQVAAFALGAEGGYTGIALDYRAVPTDLRDAYTAFVWALSGLLHSQGRELTLALPTPVYDAASDSWDTAGYDWPALGRLADWVVVLAPLDPAAYTPGGAVDRLLNWATGQVSRDELLLGVSALSVEEQDGAVAPVALADALGFLGEVQLDADLIETGATLTARLASPYALQVETGRDDATMTPYVRYLDMDGQPLRTMWITDPAALRFRLERAAEHTLTGVFVRDLLAEGTVPGLAEALLAFRANGTVEAESLAVAWTLRAGETVLAQATAGFDEPVTLQAAGTGALTVEARVAGVLVSSATVTAQDAPAPTPRPTDTSEPTPTEIIPTGTASPTSTPTNTPTATPPGTPAGVPTLPPPPTDAAPIPATDEPAATDAPGATVAPVPTADPAAIAAAQTDGAFAVGAHLGKPGPALLALGGADFAWIKYDVPYLLDQDPADWAQTISETQANGFRVLLNVIGSPAQLASEDQAAYFAAYARFAGALAGLGADGVEVWREMNSAAAWPAGLIDPAAYVELLRLTYNAVKVANPATLVITGALKPRAAGGEEARSVFGWDDDVFLTEMAAANAAEVADCLGISYLEGAVPPGAASGDPRGDAPVHYLQTITARARAAFGDSLPVCYTRLGYLAPVGDLPEGYEWAAGITVEQQAAWLAEIVAANLGSESVRLLVIWTADGSAFGPDSPDAGYAIIRPDGSCLACDSIAPLLAEE